MVNRYFSLAVLMVFLLQGCASQIISEHTQKGMLVKEEGSGKLVERSREKTIELITPFSVRVREQVEREEDTKLYYQKLLVRKKAKPREYPYLDAYLKLLLSSAVIPLFTYDYWVQGSYRGTNCSEEMNECVVRDVHSVISNEYFIEEGTRLSVQQLQNAPLTGTVTLFINGYLKEELPIDPAGIATADLLKFPELARLQRDVKLTFKYFDSYAYSVIKKNEVEKIFRQSAR